MLALQGSSSSMVVSVHNSFRPLSHPARPTYVAPVVAVVKDFPVSEVVDAMSRSRE